MSPARQLTLLAIAVFGIILRLNHFYHHEFWGDELEQLYNLNRSLPNLVTQYLRGIPGGFPGDYFLTWPLAQLTTNKWIVSIPHFGSLFLGYWLFFKIVNRDISTFPGQIVAWCLFSLNANLIFHALEFRPYAVLPALALLVYGVSTSWSPIDRPWTKTMHASWAALILFSLVFHAFGILMCAFIMSYALFQGNRTWADRVKALQRCLPATLIGLSLAAAPMWYFRNMTMTAGYAIDTFQYSGRSLMTIFVFVVGNLCDIHVRFGWIPPALLIALGLFLPVSGHRQRWSFAITLILLPITVILLQDYKHQYWFLQRQFVWVIPLASLLAAHSMDALVMRRKVQ